MEEQNNEVTFSQVYLTILTILIRGIFGYEMCTCQGILDHHCVKYGLLLGVLRWGSGNQLTHDLENYIPTQIVEICAIPSLLQKPSIF